MSTLPLKKSEAARLLTIKDKRDRLFFAIGLFSGRRCQEIANLKWGWLLDSKGPKIYAKKQRKWHYFPRSENLVQIINECYEGQGLDEYFMVARRGSFKENPKPISTTGINKIVKKYLSEFGIETVKESSHCLRKTFAIQFIEANRDKEEHVYLIDWLRQYFGHRDMRTTMLYLGLQQKKLASLCNNISYENVETLQKEKEVQDFMEIVASGS